ncbi:MAG: precorrin-6A/cobalt-precorrin-6A reductase [Cyanobacteriota bacterium]
MHDLPFDQGHGRCLWLFAGTGEGPPLARAWLERGWRLEVFVVTPSAAHAYPDARGLRLRVGAVGGSSDLRRLVQQARARGEAPHWIVDATHPFATRISSDLAQIGAELAQPLLRLLRPVDPMTVAGVRLVPDWPAVATVVPVDERVLLAIGSRHLQKARAALPGRVLRARVLPTAESLALALAAGFPAEHLAALRPGNADRGILGALCRQWSITTVVARASAGSTEQVWRQVQEDVGLHLVLLQRPTSVLPGVELTWPEALNRLSPGDGAPVQPVIAADGGPAG